MPFTSSFASMGASSAGSGAAGVPLKTATVYLDGNAPGTGAAVGNGVPFNHFQTAYEAAYAHTQAYGGAVTLHVAPGSYWAMHLTLSEQVLVIGSGIATTRIEIYNVGISSNHLTGRDFRLALSISGAPGADGNPASEWSPESNSATEPGQDIYGSVIGTGGSIALLDLNVYSGNGGNASGPWDDGETQRFGASGSSAGAISFVVSGVERQTETWNIIMGTPGAASGGIHGGGDGSPGWANNGVVRFQNVRHGLSPVQASTLYVSGPVTCYALSSQLGHITGGSWLGNSCQFLTLDGGSYMGSGDGAPNYVYASGL